MSDKSNVAVLKGPDYLSDVAKSLRAIADEITEEPGKTPDVAVLVIIREGEPVTVYSVGHKSNDYGAIAALEIGKQYVMGTVLEVVE